MEVPGPAPGSDSADKASAAGAVRCLCPGKAYLGGMAASEGTFGLLTVWGRESFLYGWLPVPSIVHGLPARGPSKLLACP